MPYDSMAMAATTDELQDWVGAQVQRIIQPSAGSVALSLYGSGKQRWLTLSSEARSARIAFAGGKLAKAFPTPSPFIMLLRKYLEGRRILAVEQVPYERVMFLRLPGEDGDLRLVGEVMGKHSNVILVSPEGKILGALKVVSAERSRVRPVVPGERYRLPPEQQRDEELFGSGCRLDPYGEPDQFRTVFRSAARDVSIRKALLGLLPGASPFLVQEIAARAGHREDTPLGAVNADDVARAAADLYELRVSQRWEPTVFSTRDKSCDFAPFMPLTGTDVVRVASISEAADQCLGGAESHDALSARRKRVDSEIRSALRAAQRRTESLQRGLAAASNADEARERGELILAYQHLIKPGDERLTISDLDLALQLDPQVSSVENAERAFRRYRKLRDARRRIPELLAKAQEEQERLEELERFAALADSEADLRELEGQIRPMADGENDRRRQKARRKSAEYRIGDRVVLAGRNARENEEVTFRLARRDDLWFHARGRTGAHVVLRGGAGEDNDELVEKVARLAAWLSQGRNDSAVDVIVTPVRNVRKVPGPPGRVTYRDEKTVRATPSADDWRRV